VKGKTSIAFSEPLPFFYHAESERVLYVTHGPSPSPLVFSIGLKDVARHELICRGPVLTNATHDYVPDPMKNEPHSFMDLASDVVIDGDVAWIVGMSKGKHDANDEQFKPLRGILVPMNLHTGKLAGPVIVAPAAGGWLQSALFGAAPHPEGVLATGYGCDKTCSTYRIETSLYSVDGVRTWFEHEADNAGLAYGSDVAFDGQGRALVSAAVTQNGKLRGYVFGREVGPPGVVLFQHWYPGAGPSEALGIVRDGFDRIFPVGYVTVNGETEARVTRIHG